MIGVAFNPDNCIFITNQSLNANQFNPNVPDAGTNEVHTLLYDTVSTSFIWVDTKTNLIVFELSGTPGQKVYDGFFQRVTDVVGTIAANNGKALFQTAAASNTTGLTTVAASGDIIVGAAGAGTYKVSYQVAGVEANAFGLFIGAVVVPGSISGSGAGLQQNNGQCIVTLAAADVVSLRTVDCATPITLALAGTTNVLQNVASIVFEKLS